MGCHSAPGLFCSLPVGLSCLLRAGALWDLSLPLLVQQWSFHSCSPGNPAGLTLTTALGQWESSHPVSLELDKAHGPFETHHSEYWSKRPAPGYGFMECQRSGVGTIPDIVPVSSSWHSIKQSLGQLFWGFHGHPLTEGICGVRLMPHLFSRTVHQQRNMGCVLPSLCYLLQLHFWLSHLPCMCLIGHNESWLWSNQTWFWRPKYCPRWGNPGCTNSRQLQVWNPWGFTPRVCEKEKTAFNCCGLPTRQRAEVGLCPQHFPLQPHESKWMRVWLFQGCDSALLISKLARNANLAPPKPQMQLKCLA